MFILIFILLDLTSYVRFYFRKHFGVWTEALSEFCFHFV